MFFSEKVKNQLSCSLIRAVKKSRGVVYLGPKKPPCLYNHSLVIRLFSLKSSFQEVFFKKSAAILAAGGHPMLKYDLNKVPLQLYIKFAFQHGCSPLNLMLRF